MNEYPRCPSSVNEMEYACGAVPGSTLRYTSSCGGFSFVVTKGNAQSIWHYDADQKLVGASITQDTTASSGNTCTASSTHLYGKTCEISGAPVDLCVQSVSPCVRPLGCSDPDNSNVQNCPSSPEALLSLCNGFVQLSRSASSCGGSIIHAEFGTHSEDWAFDAAKQLIGKNYQDDIAARCPDGTQASLSVFGKACAVQGQPEILCDYAPDPGAAGGGAP